MKLKMLIILIIISCFIQVTKEKIKIIIRIAIISKLKMFHTFIIIHTNLNHNLFSISHSHFIESISSNKSSNINESFNDHEIFIKNI